jgi:hypothetical protein
MAFEHDALKNFRFTLDAVSEVDCSFFLRHLPNDAVETSILLVDRCVRYRLQRKT